MEDISFTLTNFKVFDSSKVKNPQALRMERMVTVYEFEFYTESCEGGHWLDGKFYPVQKGGCFLAKPGQYIKTVFPYKCAFLDIQTKDKVLLKMFDDLPSYFVPMDLKKMVDYLHRMVALSPSRELEDKLQIYSYACRILARLDQYRQTTPFTDRGTILHQQGLLLVDRYIRDHYAEDLSVGRLANLCNLDPTYFHKLYTAAFGITPAKRILGFRINAAKRGLIAGETSLEELASSCGFSSQAYFCYRFKQIVGLTPLQYRDEQLSKAQTRDDP